MRRAWLIVMLGGALASPGLLAPVSALAGPAEAVVAHAAPRATAPTVTLTSPASGGIVIGGQPTFSGTASTGSTDATTVTVDLYAGSTAGGTPLEQLSATVSGGGYSIGPSTPLADGAYTAQAFQADTATPPDVGGSAAVTFWVDNAPAAIELDQPASEPQLTSTPTLTGFAGTFLGDAATVTALVYPGAGTDATPVGTTSSPIASNGAFSVQLAGGLADGVYTVIAGQSTTLGAAFSAPVTIEIEAMPPALTVTAPTPGQSVSQAAVSFAGAAGESYGDSGDVDLSLFRGGDTTGRRVGALTVARTGGSWQAAWPTTLSLGIYTLRAEQDDTVGRVTTVLRTFIVVPPPAIIGRSVRISPTGTLTVPVDCVTSIGDCRGDVLIVTRNSFRTSPGGPVGHLRVLFVKFAATAGQTFIVRHALALPVLRVLKRAHTQKVSVTVVIAGGTATQQVYTATRSVKVAVT